MSAEIRLFRPSNGTQGDGFIAGWCGRCKRDRVSNGSVPLDDAADDDFCQILGATFRHRVTDPEYPREWQYGADGNPECTAFEPMDAPDGPSCAVRDDRAADLFAEVRTA